MNQKINIGDAPALSDVSPGFHFGEHLRRKIADRGFSIREAARRIGIAHPQLFRWLGQPHAPKQRSLERIARGLDCPVTDLLLHGNKKDTSGESALLVQIAELERNLEGYRKEMEEQIMVFGELYRLLNNPTENKNPVMALNGIRLKISEVVLKYEKNRLFGFF